MNASDLQIDFYYVESLRWKAEPGFSGAAAPLLEVGDLQWSLGRQDDEGGQHQTAYRLTLRLEPSPESDPEPEQARFPYSFEIVLVGLFHLAESVPASQAEAMLDANAPALLYSAAREALSTTLARGPFPPLLLPAVHFLNLQREAPAKQPAVEPVEQLAPPKRRSAAAGSKSPKARPKAVE